MFDPRLSGSPQRLLLSSESLKVTVSPSLRFFYNPDALTKLDGMDKAVADLTEALHEAFDTSDPLARK